MTAESNSYVYAYGGNDSIYIGNTDQVTVDAGAGNDTIYNYWGWYTSINGGDGNDKIYLNSGESQKNATVKGGYGNNTIFGDTGGYTFYGVTYQFTAGEGYDLIYNFNSNDTISLGVYYSSNYYTRSTVGSNVIISLIGGGAITLSGASGKTINVANGIQTVVSSVIEKYNTYSLVSGSSSADTIKNYAGGVTVRGGAGADKISLTGDKLTVRGGKGNDIIYGNTATGHLYEYSKGDGSDIIYNFGSKDSITISGSIWSTSKSGNDVLVNYPAKKRI